MDSMLKPNPNTEQLDIYVKRILAKYSNVEEILFAEEIVTGTPKNKKVPLDFCIDKKTVNCKNYGVKCINEVKITDWCANQDIICNHKAKFTITYKVVLWIKYEDNSFGIVVLPDDVYKDCPTASFISKMNVPQTIGPNESLEIIDTDTDSPKFKWTKCVPLTEFDAEIPCEVFEDPTLQSHLLIKAVRPEYDILNDCPYSTGTGGSITAPIPGIGPHGVGHDVDGDDGGVINGWHSYKGATEIKLALYAELLDKLGVEQDILIEGIPMDC